MVSIKQPGDLMQRFALAPSIPHLGLPALVHWNSALSAYNAAHMRLDRGTDGNRAAALALFERGKALGDAKSHARLDIERARK
jgi:hypothetical protein